MNFEVDNYEGVKAIMFNAEEMNNLSKMSGNKVPQSDNPDYFDDVFDLIKEEIEHTAGLGYFTTSIRGYHFPNELNDYFYENMNALAAVLNKQGFTAYKNGVEDIEPFLFVSWEKVKKSK